MSMVEIFDDIRKLYQFESPCSELAEYIEFFSETSLVATDRYITTEKFSVRLFPSYTPTVWINLGAPYQLKNGNNYHLIGAQTDILLLRNEIVERVNLPTDNIFTIKFFPGGLEAILGISQTSLGSDIVDASHIIPLPVIQKLKRPGAFKERVSLLQSLFLQKLERKYSTQHYLKSIKRAIDAFCSSGMEASNTELAKQTYLTDKTLYRYFLKAIGTTPKNYFATVRARTALTAFVADTNSFSPYEYGYYDMSHFYKDVTRFTGQKLSFYRF